MEISVAPRIGQAFYGVVGRNAFIAEAEIRLLLRVEIVIDAAVVLFATSGCLPHAEKIVEAAEATNVTIAGDIQAIDNWPAAERRQRVIRIREVIGLRH